MDKNYPNVLDHGRSHLHLKDFRHQIWKQLATDREHDSNCMPLHVPVSLSILDLAFPYYFDGRICTSFLVKSISPNGNAQKGKRHSKQCAEFQLLWERRYPRQSYQDS